MDSSKGKGRNKGNLIIKTWERCKTIGRGHNSSSSSSSKSITRVLYKKSKSLPHVMAAYPTSTQEDDETIGKRRKKGRVAPEGCFSVYVGPQRERFVIKTEYVNHPLFKLLLEEAESEYGYNSEGPLVLPCNVDVFYKVLLAMDDCGEIRQGCGFAKGLASYRLLSPPRLVAINQF